MAPHRAIIDEIRRVKFSIGSSTMSPLAQDLHRSITHLSVELYQNDMHFLIQNAEDNSYEENVCPSLQFLLTNEDVAQMGVASTLLVLNNEKGLKPSDVRALYSMEDSTKKGKRNEGLIGCKGIGFKSVFMVCKTPIIISGGFRIRLRDEPCKEGGTAYIVPEWSELPADLVILSACGLEEIPTTVVVLCLRHNKVDLARRQLRGISPENILFLSKIRELRIVDRADAGTADKSDRRRSSLRIARSEPILARELWLKNLPDAIYVGALWFFLSDLKLLKNGWWTFTRPLFKIRVGDGEVEMVSYSHLEGFEVICIPSLEDTEWTRKWVKAFASTDPLKVLAPKFSQALLSGGGGVSTHFSF